MADKNVVEEVVQNESDADIIEKSLIDVDDNEEVNEDGNPKEKVELDEDGNPKEKSSDEGDIKMPDLGEGVELDYGLFEKMLPVLKDMKATQEQVDQLAKTYLGHVENAAKQHGDKLISKYNEIKDGWKNDTSKHFGADIKQNLAFVGNALKQFGSPELVELFNETGVGNHVEVVKCFSKIGKKFSEDTFVDGNSTINSNPEDVLYKTMK